jgi:GT2 family glycosyltransferase
MTADTLTVIIVSRDLEGVLAHCLHALRAALAHDGGAHAIVVVDNGSPAPYDPGLVGADVDLLRLDVPTSFAAANNRAARRRPAGAYLLLNNDVFLHPHAIADMRRVLADRPDVGICGTRLRFPDGTIQHAGVVFGGGSRGPYHVRRRRPDVTAPRGDREWQAVTGACMLVRRVVWDELGGLDETYPFGLEDIDFCLRARSCQWRVYACNGTDSLHFESLTPGRVQLDVASRRVFMERWQGRYSIDG